jgi:Ni,Fe-hydrogenase maturation factor
MVRVLCVGNRFHYPDNFGIAVYERLEALHHPLLEVVEGGVGGLNLLPWFEDDTPMIVVDHGTLGEGVVPREAVDALPLAGYSHADALLYLLKSVDRPYTLYLRSDYDDHVLETSVREIVALAEKMTKARRCG